MTVAGDLRVLRTTRNTLLRPRCRTCSGVGSLECSLAFGGLLSARSIESDGRADERLERIRVNLLTLVNVDGAPYVPLKARVEELGRILQGSALKEGQLHDRLVRLSGADAPVMGPYRGPHPLPLFHNIRVGLPDEGAHPCQCIASPVTQLGNPFADSFGRRLACSLWSTLHLRAFRWGNRSGSSRRGADRRSPEWPAGGARR